MKMGLGKNLYIVQCYTSERQHLQVTSVVTVHKLW